MDGQTEREARLHRQGFGSWLYASADGKTYSSSNGDEWEKSVSVEAILRPLVEATVVCPECSGTGQRWVIGQGTVRNNEERTQTVAGCPTTLPDPRFEALRLGRYQDAGGGAIPGWRIDASLGAIHRAVVACGLVVTWLSEDMAKVEERYNVEGKPRQGIGEGATPEKAAARALVAAVDDEKRRVITPNHGG